MKRRLNNQRGAALPLVLVTLMILSIFSLTVIFLSNSNFKSEKREENRTKAYYISRTGSEAFADKIAYKVDNDSKKLMTIEEIDKFVGKTSKPTQFGEGSFTINVEKVSGKTSEHKDYKVTSKATVNGVSETTSVIVRPSEAEFSVSNKVFKDRVLLSSCKENKMQIGSLGDKGYIRGPNPKETSQGLVQTAHSKIDYGDSDDKKRIKSEVNKTEDNLIDPEFTEFRELNHVVTKASSHLEIKDKNQVITQNKEIGSIQVKTNKSLEIDASKEDVKIVVRGDVQLDENSTLEIKTAPSTKVDMHVGSIQLQNKSKLKITGGGNVNIISKGDIQLNDYIEIIGDELKSSVVNFKSLTEIQIDNRTQLKFDNNIKVYFYSTGNIQLQQSSKLNATNNAKVHFFSDGGSIDMFQNTIVTTDADLNKNAVQSSQIFIVAVSSKVTLGQNSVFEGYIYAPNSDIQVHEDAKLQGSFIGKTVQTGENMKLDHAWPSDEDVEHLTGIIPNGNTSGSYKDTTYEIERREE